MNRIWSDEEVELLNKVYPIKTIEELCELFPNKTDKQINKKAKNLKLKKDKLFIKEYRLKKSLAARSDLWTKEEFEILQVHYPKGGIYEVKKYLPHKSNDAIRRKANSLGITIQNDEYWDLNKIEQANENPYAIKVSLKKKVTRDDNKTNNIEKTGKFDNYTWEEREDFSFVGDLEFPKEVLISFFKSILELHDEKDNEN
ncbi:hypothetical protein V7138_10310 [Bacillus sp. JJ1533]|uniref:hypothetical protein n=1 Tax=Bacillus sp. JJ1533 TaxID=3122959 RepID=UPI002FFE8632